MFSATETDYSLGVNQFVTDPIDIVVGGDQAPVRNVLQSFVELVSTYECCWKTDFNFRTP